MSRKHGHSRKRRRKAATKAAAKPAALLGAVAAALNSCADAGLSPRLVQGAVMTRAGYVLFLPGDRKRDRWAARALTYDPLSPPDDGED